MKYFVIEVSSTDYETYAKGISEKDNIEDARMLFHQIMASAYANPDVLYAMCIIYNDRGGNELIEIKRKEKEKPEENE